MRLFRNPKSSLYLIAAFVIVLLVLFARHSRASELQLEGGAAVLRGYTPALGLSIQWPDKGPAQTDYELGFLIIGDGEYNDAGIQQPSRLVRNAVGRLPGSRTRHRRGVLQRRVAVHLSDHDGARDAVAHHWQALYTVAALLDRGIVPAE